MIEPFLNFEGEAVKTLIDDETSPGFVYVGHTIVTTATSAQPVWFIKRLALVGDQVVGVEVASRKFDQIFDNREDLFGDIPFVNRVSLLCDAGNDYVEIGDVPALQFERTDPFSMMSWFRTTRTQAGAIISKQGGSNNPGYRLITQAGQVRFHLAGQGGSGDRIEVRTVDNTFADDNWHQAIVTYDGSSDANGVTIDVDGAPQALTQNTNGLSTSILNSIPAQICGRNQTTDTFGGFLDEPSIWNKELTTFEKQEIWNNGIVEDLRTFSSSPSLVGWWPFDGSVYPNIIDFSPSNNTATMFSMQESALVREVP